MWASPARCCGRAFFALKRGGPQDFFSRRLKLFHVARRDEMRKRRVLRCPGEQETAPPRRMVKDGRWARHARGSGRARAHAGSFFVGETGARVSRAGSPPPFRWLLGRSALPRLVRPVYGRSGGARFEVGTVAMFELRQGRAMRRNQFWVNRETARAHGREPRQQPANYPRAHLTHPHNKLFFSTLYPAIGGWVGWISLAKCRGAR